MQLASANYISIFFINHANAFAVRSTILNLGTGLQGVDNLPDTF